MRPLTICMRQHIFMSSEQICCKVRHTVVTWCSFLTRAPRPFRVHIPCIKRDPQPHQIIYSLSPSRLTKHPIRDERDPGREKPTSRCINLYNAVRDILGLTWLLLICMYSFRSRTSVTNIHSGNGENEMGSLTYKHTININTYTHGAFCCFSALISVSVQGCVLGNIASEGRCLTRRIRRFGHVVLWEQQSAL